MIRSRRVFVASLTVLLALVASGVVAAVVPRVTNGTPAATGGSGRTQVYLLGSQGGQQRTQLTGANVRAGTSALIVVDGVGYMLDAGVGALLRLNEAGFDPNIVRHVFVTHHHQDHNADLGNVIGFSWTAGRWGSADRRLDVWGPPGTRAYIRGYKISTARNIADQEGPLEEKPTLDAYLHGHELSMRGAIRTEGVRVMGDARVTVSAIRVNHGSMPTVGYRFETPDLKIVFSGDRGDRGDDLARFAMGADVLFHEISDLDVVKVALHAQGAPPRYVDHQIHDHSSGELVGRTATAAGVPKLVLYHLVPGTPALSDERWRSLVSPYYAGEIVVGKDLLEF
jgi:ribonuclease BN (tRNA processing enzyme)